jgi:Ca2+-binding RTX toxin-like protein
MNGTEGDDTIRTGFDAACITSGTGMTINLAATNLEWVADFAGGNDTIDGSGTSVNLEVYAAGGTDIVTGGTGADFLWGGAGTDTLNGNGGASCEISAGCLDAGGPRRAPTSQNCEGDDNGKRGAGNPAHQMG